MSQVESSVDFPYSQKKLLATSFIGLGIISTIVSLLKIILICSYSNGVNFWTAYSAAFIVIQLCSFTFIILGVKWLKKCREHVRALNSKPREIKLHFDDASIKKFTVSNTTDTQIVVDQLLKIVNENTH